MIDELRKAERKARRDLYLAEANLLNREKHNQRVDREVGRWANKNPDAGKPNLVGSGKTPDVPLREKYPEEHLEELRTEVHQAKKAYESIRAALEEAVESQEPAVPKTPTGWEALKNTKIAGVNYGAGDPFNVKSVGPKKLKILESAGLVGKS